MSVANELLERLDKLQTTELGIVRIKRNLSLDVDDVVEWCRDKIKSDNAVITRNGKNWYINIDACIITVNAYSYTIITAHKEMNYRICERESFSVIGQEIELTNSQKENIKICVDFWRKFNNNLKKNIYHKLEMGLNMLLWKDEKK